MSEGDRQNGCHHFHCGSVRFCSFFFVFTTDRWQQPQASSCFQQWLKHCVASQWRTAKCCSVLPNSRQSHLGDQLTLQCTSSFSFWFQNAVQFWSNWPPVQDVTRFQCCLFHFFFNYSACTAILHFIFVWFCIFHGQLPRSRLKEGSFVPEQNDWKCSGSGAWWGWRSPFHDYNLCSLQALQGSRTLR